MGYPPAWAAEVLLLDKVVWRAFDIAIFDCDSTLSSIEGIDELAKICGKKAEVKALTDAAMNGEIDLVDVYGKRLELLNPTLEQVTALRQAYKKTALLGAKETIGTLNKFGTDTWIVSGGLADAVSEFGVWLGVAEDHVKAVGATYDPLGHKWWTQSQWKQPMMTYEAGELTATVGKADVIDKSIGTKGRKIMFGDGMSDLAATSAVDLFVCFAGVVDRPAVSSKSQVVIKVESLEPALALILGPGLTKSLATSGNKLAARSLQAAKDGAIVFNDQQLESAFLDALAGV